MGNRLAVEMSYSSQGERPARSRNSGGGGGGGGNSNRVPGTGRCFSCGQEGHWARECPRKSEGGGGNNNSGGDRSYGHRNNGGGDRHHPYRPRITGGGRRGDRSPRRYSTNYDRSPSPHGRSPSPRGGRDRGGDRGADRNIDRDRYSPRKTADDRYSPKHERSPVNKVGGGDKDVDQRSPPPRKRTPSPVGRNPRNRSPDRGRDRGDRSDRDNRGNGNDRGDRGNDRDNRDNRENRDNRSGSSDRQDRDRGTADRDSRRKDVDSDSPKDKGGDDVHPMNDDD